jgi:hypothetical protein
MNLQAILEGAAFILIAIVLGLTHVWNYHGHAKRKADAEEVLRLASIRQTAVQQLKSEQRMWAVARTHADRAGEPITST